MKIESHMNRLSFHLCDNFNVTNKVTETKVMKKTAQINKLTNIRLTFDFLSNRKLVFFKYKFPYRLLL